jgi:preprotein translocase subunit Sec61beta
MKYLIGILVVVAAIFIGIGLPAFMGAVTDFRTDTVSNDFTVATNATSVNGTVQLSKQLWEADLTNATLTSNNVLDTPAITTFTAGSRALTFNGLTPNASRLITVEYKTAGLTGYQGAETGIKLTPALIVMAIILLPLFSFVMIFTQK